jgi:hypothetical protein
MLSSMGVQDAETALGQARMWDSTQQLAALGEQIQQQKTAIASQQQQYEAQQVQSGKLLSSVQAVQQQQAQQRAAVTVVAHAPADMHPDQLIHILSENGGISWCSFHGARVAFAPRDSSGRASEGCSSEAAAAGGSSATREAGSSAAAGGGAAAAVGSKQGMAVF